MSKKRGGGLRDFLLFQLQPKSEGLYIIFFLDLLYYSSLNTKKKNAVDLNYVVMLT